MDDFRDHNQIPIQNVQVFDHLRDFGSITSREALDSYGVFRLAARIYDLRQLGHNIITVRVLNEYGNSYARYHLLQQALDEWRK
jgi:hypothetical protein